MQSTFDTQTQTFNSSTEVIRDTDYFEQEISNIRTAEELVNDRRLLRVALGAFGLSDDINNRFLIRTVLEEGTESNEALANRLSDDRYAQLASAFRFDEIATPATIAEGFGVQITEQFRRREFEVAVGEQNDSMRLALNAKRELTDLATSTDSDDTRWFQILGTPPLREVFETALGLPDGFALLDIDRQHEIFKDKARTNLGLESLDALADEDVREDLVRTFLVREQIQSINFLSPVSIALTLLQGG